MCEVVDRSCNTEWSALFAFKLFSLLFLKNTCFLKINGKLSERVFCIKIDFVDSNDVEEEKVACKVQIQI